MLSVPSPRYYLVQLYVRQCASGGSSCRSPTVRALALSCQPRAQLDRALGGNPSGGSLGEAHHVSDHVNTKLR